MTSPVVTVTSEAPLGEIHAVLERRGVSSVPVVAPSGHVVGIVSSTDLVRAMAEVMQAPRDVAVGVRTAADVMRSPVLVAAAHEGIRGAARRMVEHRVHRLVVVDDGLPVGILSARDVLDVLRAERIEAPIEGYMTREVVSVQIGDGIDVATAALAAAGVHGVLVCDREAPIGVFTQAEALAARRLSRDLWSRPVEEVMSYEVVSLDAKTPTFRAAAYLVSLDARRIVVTSEGRTVGILGCLDVVRAALG